MCTLNSHIGSCPEWLSFQISVCFTQCGRVNGTLGYTGHGLRARQTSPQTSFRSTLLFFTGYLVLTHFIPLPPVSRYISKNLTIPREHLFHSYRLSVIRNLIDECNYKREHFVSCFVLLSFQYLMLPSYCKYVVSFI